MNEDRPAVLMDLPTSVRGFCYHDDNGDYIVVLNSRLSREANQSTYFHEQDHIARGDLDDLDYYEYGGAS